MTTPCERYNKTAFKRYLRRKLMKEQKGRCYYCSTEVVYGSPRKNGSISPRFATLDHIVPKSRGAGLNGNTVLACHQCNNERGDRDARHFLLEKMGLA